MRPELPAAERAAIEAVLIEASGRFNMEDPPLCREPFALARMIVELRERLVVFEAIARMAAPDWLPEKCFAAILQCGAR